MMWKNLHTLKVFPRYKKHFKLKFRRFCVGQQSSWVIHVCWSSSLRLRWSNKNSALQKTNSITVYFSGKQLLLFVFTRLAVLASGQLVLFTHRLCLNRRVKCGHIQDGLLRPSHGRRPKETRIFSWLAVKFTASFLSHGGVANTTSDLPMMAWCWPIVYDAGPTSSQHWLKVSCLV